MTRSIFHIVGAFPLGLPSLCIDWKRCLLVSVLADLEAGCRQKPRDGSVLVLGGSNLSTRAADMVAQSSQSQAGEGSSLSPSAIAGIVVGLLVVFLTAAALFTVYWRRERALDGWRDAQYYGSRSISPDPRMHYYNAGMPQACRRYYTGNAFSEKAAPPFTTSGDYYDHVEAQLGHGQMHYNPEPHIHGAHAGSFLPTHEAYRPETKSRTESRLRTDARISALATAHRVDRANAPDSFAVQAYLDTAERSAHPPPPQAWTRASLRPKMRSVVFPSLTRLRIPKKREPLGAAPATAAPAGGLQASCPAAQGQATLGDGCMGRAPVSAAQQQLPSPRRQGTACLVGDVVEIPLRSGKSTLYG